MNPAAPILVGIHREDAGGHDAVALGVRLARITGEQLALASVWATPFGHVDPLLDDTVRGEILRELEVLAAGVPRDVRVRLRLSSGTSVARGLRRAALDEHAAVLVLGSGAEAGARLRIVQEAPCPVMIAPEGFADRPPADDVLLAWDGSTHAEAALEHAVALTHATGGTLRLVAVLDRPDRPHLRPADEAASRRAWLEELRAIIAGSLDEAVARVAGRVPVTTTIVEGRPAPALARAAAGAGFLVTGPRGRGPLHRLVFGSTTSDLIGRVSVPTLLCPHDHRALSPPMATTA